MAGTIHARHGVQFVIFIACGRRSLIGLGRRIVGNNQPPAVRAKCRTGLVKPAVEQHVGWLVLHFSIGGPIALFSRISITAAGRFDWERRPGLQFTLKRSGWIGRGIHEPAIARGILGLRGSPGKPDRSCSNEQHRDPNRLPGGPPEQSINRHFEPVRLSLLTTRCDR